MILYPLDGSAPREISGDELRDMLRKAPRDEPVRRFADVGTCSHRTTGPVRRRMPDGSVHFYNLKSGDVVDLYGADPEDWHFAVDAAGGMTMFPLVDRRRRFPRLRFAVISVSVATLAGLIAAGFL